MLLGPVDSVCHVGWCCVVDCRDLPSFTLHQDTTSRVESSASLGKTYGLVELQVISMAILNSPSFFCETETPFAMQDEEGIYSTGSKDHCAFCPSGRREALP